MAKSAEESPIVVVRPYREGDEKEIVEVLNQCFPEAWGSVEEWNWKYRRRPTFDPECIYVAESGGKIVGCWHSLAEEVTLGTSTCLIGLEGDGAILASHRGGGIVLRLYDATSRALVAKGATLRIGFTTPELADTYYTKLYGYVKMPVLIYTKVIRSEELVRALSRLVERVQKNETLGNDLGEIRLTLQFRFQSMAPFWLGVQDGTLVVRDGEADSPEIVVAGDQEPLVTAIRSRAQGGNRTDLLKALLNGRVTVKGWFRNALALRKLLKALMKVQGGGANP